MANIRFIYRRNYEECFLKIRFLYKVENETFFVEADSRVKVDKTYWVKYHIARNVTHPIYKDIKKEVSKKLRELKKLVLEEATKVELYTRQWLESIVEKYYTPKAEVIQERTTSEELKCWFDQYVYDKGSDVTTATLSKAKSIKNLLIRFEKSTGEVLNVKDIDIKFSLKFVEYCKEQGYAQNTIARNLVFIKTICNHARIFDIPVSGTLELVRTKRERVKSIYLEKHEIEWIEELEFSNRKLEIAKDWLLISYYTGQRISDFMRFDKSMIRYQKNRKGDTKPLLEFIQQKTGKLMTIPLSSKVIDILDRRVGEFPKSLSAPSYNLLIKQVCKEAGINTRLEGKSKVKQKDGSWRSQKGIFYKWELVSSHIGRRSFATNNYGSIPTVFLMNMTGHGSESMFLTYIGKGSTDIAIQLSEYFD